MEDKLLKPNEFVALDSETPPEIPKEYTKNFLEKKFEKEHKGNPYLELDYKKRRLEVYLQQLKIIKKFSKNDKQIKDSEREIERTQAENEYITNYSNKKFEIKNISRKKWDKMNDEELADVDASAVGQDIKAATLMERMFEENYREYPKETLEETIEQIKEELIKEFIDNPKKINKASQKEQNLLFSVREVLKKSPDERDMTDDDILIKFVELNTCELLLQKKQLEQLKLEKKYNQDYKNFNFADLSEEFDKLWDELMTIKIDPNEFKNAPKITEEDQKRIEKIRDKIKYIREKTGTITQAKREEKMGKPVEDSQEYIQSIEETADNIYKKYEKTGKKQQLPLNIEETSFILSFLDQKHNKKTIKKYLPTKFKRIIPTLIRNAEEINGILKQIIIMEDLYREDEKNLQFINKSELKKIIKNDFGRKEIKRRLKTRDSMKTIVKELMPEIHEQLELEIEQEKNN